jgi:hypothetical protein
MRRLGPVLSAIVGVAAVAAAAPASAGAAPQSTRAPESQTARAITGVIAGVVSDERGGPLMGAMVTVAGATMAMTVTDPQGRFSLDKLPPGEYVLRAHLQGFSASPRRLVQVGGSPAVHRLQLRRLDVAVGTAGDAPLPARPIIAAGFELPRTETPEAEAGKADGSDHPHTELAWRLRHIKRSILKDTAPAVIVADAEPPAESIYGRSASAAYALSNAAFTDLPFSGEVNLLTTSAFSPGTWSGTELPRGVAYFSLGAPTPAGDWLVRGAMSQGDLSSWIMAGSFVSARDPVHTYEIGLTYATQEYFGGNPAALGAVKDGSRNVGEIRAVDRWAVSPGLMFEYGGRYARYDYLEDRGLLSPQVGMTLEPAKGTRVRAVLSQRMLAPGAEEFLSPGTAGPWLPPERTFSPLIGTGPFRAERARSLDVIVEHEFEDTYVVGVRRFFQDVHDQLATIFGVAPSDLPGSVGHYFVANAGSLTADGWGVRVSSPPGRRIRASLDYSLARARWVTRGDSDDLIEWASAAVRPDTEDIHDVTGSFETDITETATRVYVIYKVNSAYTRDEPGVPAGMDGRFDLQVNQGLPFDVAGTRWEVLVGVRNLFRDATDPASVYDELLVVKPPKRVVGGFLVRF